MNQQNPSSKPKRSSGLAAVLQSMGARILIVFVNAATGILTARSLHPAGRGELAAMAMWPNFLASAMTFGLPSALIFHSRTDEENRANLVWAAFPMTLILGLFATLLGAIAMPFWLKNYSPAVIFMAQVFMLNAPVGILINVTRASCESRGDFFASAFSLFLTPFLSLVALVIIQVTRGLTPTSAAFGYILGGIVPCIWLVVRTAKSIGRRTSKLVPHARKLLSYGIRSYGVDLCGTLSLYADQVLVVRLLNPAAMGTYVVALSLSRMLNVVHTAVAAVLFPKAVSLEKPDLIKLTGRTVRTSTSLTAVGGVCLVLIGPAALSLLYGKEYRGATAILNILVAEVVLTGATLVLTQAFMALGRPGLVTILQSSGLVLSIPLLIVLVPRFGVLGAASALLTASIVRLSFTLASFRIFLKASPPRIVPKPSELLALARELVSHGKKIFARSQAPAVAVAPDTGR